MKIKFTLWQIALVVFLTTNVFAAKTVIYVHGFSYNPVNSSPYKEEPRGDYWGTVQGQEVVYASAAGVAKRIFVYYDGFDEAYSWKRGNPSGGMKSLYTAVSKFCTGSNRCRLVGHSMGGLLAAYFLSRYGSSFNIDHAVALSSAEGGSPLATVGTYGGILPKVLSAANNSLGVASDLKRMVNSNAIAILRPESVRAKWNHNDTDGKLIYMVAGSNKNGQAKIVLDWARHKAHDGVVPFHSECGYSAISTEFTQCGGQNVREGRETKTYSPWNGRRVHSSIKGGVYHTHSSIKKAGTYHCSTPNSAYDGCQETSQRGACRTVPNYVNQEHEKCTGRLWWRKCTTEIRRVQSGTREECS